MTVKPAIYARVSTLDQDCQIQLDGLRAMIQAYKWPLATDYIEKQSGKEGARRPVMDNLLEACAKGKHTVVLCWKLDRFGRSLLDTLTNIAVLDKAKVRFMVPSMGIDTDDSSPTGKFILQIFAAIAELERAFILERTQGGFRAYQKAFEAHKVGSGAGKTRHSKSGKDLPIGRPTKSIQIAQARRLQDQGLSHPQIAKIMGVSKSKVQKALKKK